MFCSVFSSLPCWLVRGSSSNYFFAYYLDQKPDQRFSRQSWPRRAWQPARSRVLESLLDGSAIGKPDNSTLLLSA